MPMHDSPRDQVLEAMAGNGWAIETNGHVEAPTGWFAVVVNEEAEVPEITDAFEMEIVEAGLLDLSQLIGNFLVQRLSDGSIRVYEHPAKFQALGHYDRMCETFIAWDDDQH